MALVTDAGSMSKGINNLTSTDDVAILLDDCVDKYHPGTQVFKLQSLSGLQPDSKVLTTEYCRYSNLMNKDTTGLIPKPVNKSAALKLKLPVSVTRTFPDAKFIPAGTRFIVSFVGGDLSKDPIIIRGEWEDNGKK
jgi:hypothetical protein